MKILIWFCLILLIITSCEKKSSITKVDFNERVFKSRIIASYNNKFMLLDLCKIVTVKWDSILIVPPYVDMKELDLIHAIGINQIKTKIEIMSLSDGSVHLIIIKDNQIVEYGEINTTVLNLLTLTRQDGKIKKLIEGDCSKFFVNPKTTDGEMIKVYKN